MSGAFLDTNVLVYAFTVDDHRQPEAVRLIRSGCTISAQCLNECATVARRKLRLSWSEVSTSLAVIVRLSRPIIPLTLDIHHRGLQLAERYQFSVNDAMIVAAALTADCDILCSEDMQAGLVVDGRLTIVNPFAPVA